MAHPTRRCIHQSNGQRNFIIYILWKDTGQKGPTVSRTGRSRIENKLSAPRKKMYSYKTRWSKFNGSILFERLVVININMKFKPRVFQVARKHLPSKAGGNLSHALDSSHGHGSRASVSVASLFVMMRDGNMGSVHHILHEEVPAIGEVTEVPTSRYSLLLKKWIFILFN